MATFKGYNCGVKWTAGAPAGTTPIPVQQIVFAGKGIQDFSEANSLATAMNDLMVNVELQTKLIAITAPPKGAGLKWTPIASFMKFVEAVYED